MAICALKLHHKDVSVPRLPQWIECKERLRGEILAAASKMFVDRGYEAVTLRAIAKEIGYTHAVIYQHFPDKWHILAELSSETIGLMIQNFDAIAAKHPAPKERSFCDFTWLDSVLHCPSTAVPQRLLRAGEPQRHPRWTIHQ